MRGIRWVGWLAMAALAGGCAKVDALYSVSSSISTNVVLEEANFEVVKANATGKSTGFALLLGLIPIVPATTHDALVDMRRGIEIEGRPVAMANLTRDVTVLNFLIVVFPRIQVTADIIEFKN